MTLSSDAMELLAKLIEVEKWILAGDPRGEPFLKADAARLLNGHVAFHPLRFDAVLKEEFDDKTA